MSDIKKINIFINEAQRIQEQLNSLTNEIVPDFRRAEAERRKNFLAEKLPQLLEALKDSVVTMEFALEEETTGDVST